MPDDRDDPDNLLPFRPVAKPERNARKRQSRIGVDPEDLITAGAAILPLLLAVAMAFQWVPINVYTVGIVVCSGAGFVGAKLIRARRSSGPVTKHPRNGR